MTELNLVRTPEESAKLASAVRQLLLSGRPSSHWAQALTGFMANLIGPIPEQHWRDMMHESEMPCGKADCDCHTMTGQLYAGLDELRDDWLRHKDDRR